jgi:hypothetical protein
MMLVTSLAAAAAAIGLYFMGQYSSPCWPG